MQTLYLATHFNPIYWDTAYLIVNSGSLEESENESTDYKKLAKALGSVRSAGINVSLADINRSQFGFIPDPENNEILFGLKGMLNVGDDVINQIIENRPYISPRDFLQKVNPKKQSMISLIKGGAFDHMMERKLCMGWYLLEICDKKVNLTLQNMPTLAKYGILPNDTEERITARRVYEFNRYLKAVCKVNNEWYQLNERAINFLTEMGYDSCIEIKEQDKFFLNAKIWDKKYQGWMAVFRQWMNDNKEDILHSLNSCIFKEEWDKYAKGNYSSWEMEVLCFYYHEHELAKMDFEKYGISNFFELPEDPEIDSSFRKSGKVINKYKLTKICGTCIAKDKTKNMVTLLTPDGVVDVKFNKGHFALFDKQVSEKQTDGKKKIIERSWFNKGSIIMVQGVRREDTFLAKKYASSGGHQLYKIVNINDDGTVEVTSERAKGDLDEDAT